VRGGDHRLLRRDWTFSDGATASGLRVTHTFAPGQPPSAALTVADGTTTTATARWPAN
jgi:hypothetical protein